MQTENRVSADVYTMYYDKVFGYVLNRVRSRSDAEDITSEIFLKLYSMADGFDPQKKGSASYIFRVMQTTLADFYRKNKFVFVLQEDIADPPGEDLDDILLELDRALEILAEREREIVILHYYHGLSHREISEKMHLSYTNVRQLCHVSIKKLRKVMKDLCE